MKKLVCAMFFMCLLSLCLASCGNVATDTDKDTIDVTTQYYTLRIPDSWENDCFYEIYEREDYSYALNFYDKASHNEMGGGWLFSIVLLTEVEEYSNYPEYDVLGSLEVYRIGSYNIIATYPSDVQFSEKTARKYSELSSVVPDIIKTISFSDNCTFSKSPIPVLKEEIKPQIVKNFIGKWTDLGIGSRAPAGATRWNVEFRSDGTGTFEFVFEADDIAVVDFKFEPFDTYLGETMEGIIVRIDGGADVRYMAKYTWSNQFQKMLMTMYEVNNNGTPNLNVYWVYANN